MDSLWHIQYLDQGSYEWQLEHINIFSMIIHLWHDTVFKKCSTYYQSLKYVLSSFISWMKSFKVCLFMVTVLSFPGHNSHFESSTGQRQNLVGIYIFNLGSKFICIRFIFLHGVYAPSVIYLMNAF